MLTSAETDTPPSPFEAENLTLAATRDVKPSSSCGRVLVMQRDAAERQLLENQLLSGAAVEVEAFTTLAGAQRAAEAAAPALVMLGSRRPTDEGMRLLSWLREHPLLTHVPVLVMTDQPTVRAEARRRGATDLLRTPLDPDELILRVCNTLRTEPLAASGTVVTGSLADLVRKRIQELERNQRLIVATLARMSEFRDNDTGRHVIRVGRYAGIIARQMGLAERDCQILEVTAPLHDVGKVGVPDAILLKEGPLSDDERALIQLHCRWGFEIIHPNESEIARFAVGDFHDLPASELLEVASRIALTHHERWDGTGYPCGLQGEAIPIEGRIVAVADVFDALSTRRPYKPAFPIEKCLAILDEGRGTQFDPTVLDAFHGALDQILTVQRQLQDD